MNYRKSKTQNGQVLLITLLVLTIIGIVIVGLVTLSNRDVTQVVTSEKYEKLYNTAETEVRKIVDNFGRYDKTLDTLGSVFNTCLGASPSFNCTFSDTTTGNTEVETTVKVTDTKQVQGFEVDKDRSFVVKINGYAGVVRVSWDKPAAIEFSIIAQDTTTRNLKVIKDVYDLSGVYDGLVGDNPYNQPNANHTINYTVLDVNNKPLGTKITFTPTGIKGLGASDYVYYLTITPRLKNASSVRFNVIAENEPAFSFQLREFLSTTVDKKDSSSPVAQVITQIPLAPQMDSVFDYSLITNSALNSY